MREQKSSKYFINCGNKNHQNFLLIAETKIIKKYIDKNHKYSITNIVGNAIISVYKNTIFVRVYRRSKY